MTTSPIPPKGSKITTVDDVIEAAGGAKQVCLDLGVFQQALVEWRHRGIPGDRWAYFLKRGITSEALYAASMNARGVRVA